MHILLIDDDSIGVFLTKRLLQSEGFSGTVTSLLCSVEALAIIQEQLKTNSLPNVILLDINMPIMSGWDVLDALQPYEAELKGRCVIYILTSSLAPEDTARAKDNTLVAGVLHKPLSGLEIQLIQDGLQERV